MLVRRVRNHGFKNLELIRSLAKCKKKKTARCIGNRFLCYFVFSPSKRQRKQIKKTKSFATLQCHAIDHEFKDVIEIGFPVIRTLKMKDIFIITC